MSENFKKTPDRPDRTLGDEWADWDGKADEATAKTGQGLFIGFSLAVLLVIDGVLALLYYLTLPRLAQFYSGIPHIILWGIILWIVLTSVLFIQLALTIYTGRNFFFIKRQIFFAFDLVFARVFKLAKLLRISRDRMGHSFVLVSNSVVRAVDRTLKDKKLMILLPRCLTKETLQQIYKLKEQYPIEIFTVSGGELARKKVKEYNPSAIIGVACERDLVSGIRDVGHRIPVIGLANKRPNGPCKDTVVDVDELTRVVEFYLK
ncbi:MAG: hypothetical protein A3I09_01455 [Deltaproteobacteria bacterium RIFCSPLOWO2_02_FULL_47_10]|nr:MAG: hypothetical protein A3I09_01455 [Deltaproteobacteria bacterium RIFCSPLOWO2_02_FULL_47_10]